MLKSCLQDLYEEYLEVGPVNARSLVMMDVEDLLDEIEMEAAFECTEFLIWYLVADIPVL